MNFQVNLFHTKKLGWFGEGYQVENDSASELLDDKLIKVEIVKKDDLVIGYVYTVKGEGEYDVSVDKATQVVNLLLLLSPRMLMD